MEDADFSLGHVSINTRIHSIAMGGSILSSPCVNDKMIFFGCNDTYVYALDLDGNKAWSYKTNDCIFSSPTCYKDYVIIGSNDGFLYCLSRNGDLIWRFNTGNKIYANPLIVGGVVYFGSNDGIFHAVSIEDGKELWKYYHSSDIFFNSAAAVNDSLICGHMTGDLFCISSEGRLLWKSPGTHRTVHTPLILDKHHNELSSFYLRSFSSFPKSHDSKVYCASEDHFSRCLDTQTGSLIWKTQTGPVGGSSPAILDGNIICGSYDGNIYATDTRGKLKWKYQTGNRIVSSPCCSGNMAYFGSSDHNLYALDSSGKLLWRFLTDGEVISSPLIIGDVIYFGSWDCNLRAVNLRTKELLWKFRTSLPVPSFIPDPKKAGSDIQHMKRNFAETVTLRGVDVEKHYSVQTGELTNTFYGSPVNYKKKTAYGFGSEFGNYK